MLARLLVFPFAIAFASAAAASGQERKPDEKKEEKKSGSVAGVLAAKGDNWIEVKADGEEKARRYMPQWLGANLQQGAGLDKKMLEVIKSLLQN